MRERVGHAASQVLVDASAEALTLGHEAVEPEHLLVALLRVKDPVTRLTLRELEIAEERLRSQPSRGKEVGLARPLRSDAAARPVLSEETKHVLICALREAHALGDQTIEPHHILLGLACDDHEYVTRVLHSLGVTRQQIQSSILERLSSETPAMVVRAAELDTFRDLLGPFYDIIAGLPALVTAELGRPADEGDVVLALAAPNNRVGRALCRLEVTIPQFRDALNTERRVAATTTASAAVDRAKLLALRRADLAAAMTDAADAGDYGRAGALRDELQETQALARDHAELQDRQAFISARTRLAPTED